MSEKKNKKKSSLVVILEFIPFWCFFQIFRLVSFKTACFISRQIFLLMFRFDLRHRNRAISHLLHTGVAANRGEAIAISRKVFINFSIMIVEMFKVDQMFSLDRIKMLGDQESIRQAGTIGGKNINVIIVTAHYGNWELAGQTWSRISGIPIVSIMRRFANPMIGKYIVKQRECETHQCVEKDGGIKGLLKALHAGKNIAILADQHANSREGVETVFFGQPCRTHSSPALLHLKTGVPIMPAITRRCDDGFNFEVVLGKLIRYQPTKDKEADIKTVTQMYTTALEELIRPQPEQWLWAHRRWLNINRKSATKYQKAAQKR